MTAVAQMMRDLIELGVTGEALIVAVDRMVDAMLSEKAAGYREAIELATAKADAELQRRRANGRLRQARYDAKRRQMTSDDVSDDTPSPEEKVPPDPLKNSTPNPNPPSPPKGGSQPPRFQPTKVELDAIWEITPKLGRERSSRRDLERALSAAMRRGHDPGLVLAGVQAAYASTSFSGDHAKGVHRLIENDRWRSFEAEPSNVVPMDPEALLARQRAIAEWAEQQTQGNRHA